VDLERITTKYMYFNVVYARTNRCYNERDSRTSYVRSSMPHFYYSTTDLLPYKSGSQSVLHEARKTHQNFL